MSLNLNRHILLNLAIGVAAAVTVIPILNPATPATAASVHAKSEKDCYLEHESRHGVMDVTDELHIVADVPMALSVTVRMEATFNYRKCYHYRPNKPTTYDPVSLHVYGYRTDHKAFKCANTYLPGFGFRKMKVSMLLSDQRPEIDAFGGSVACKPGQKHLLNAWFFHGKNNLLALHEAHGNPPHFFVIMQPDIAGLPDNGHMGLEGYLSGVG